MPRRRVDVDAAAPPAPGTARLAALRLLGRRDYTRAELRGRLLDRGYDEDVAEDALDRLQREGAIDDRRAAAAHVRTASRVKGRGRLRIRRELEARGTSPAAIDAALAELPAEDEKAAIDRFLARRRPPGPLSRADVRRLYQQLLRRGFSADAIARALKSPGE